MCYIRVATNIHDDTIYSDGERHASVNQAMYYFRDVIIIHVGTADGLRCEIEVVTKQCTTLGM
jgi:hypothetical protein